MVGVVRVALFVLALGVGVVAFNVVTEILLRPFRLDFTEQKVYTLSSNTKALLQNLSSPVYLKLFVSEKLSYKTGFEDYGKRVKDLLKEYVRLGKGKVQLEIIDPIPFSEAEEEALSYKIQGIPVSQRRGDFFYFGLAGENALSGVELIPLFAPQREMFLEQDISSLIDKLSALKRPRIGILTSLPFVFNTGEPFNQGKSTYLYEVIKERFEVEYIPLAGPYHFERYDVIMVVQPGEQVQIEALQALNRYVVEGGRLLVMVDPYVELQSRREQVSYALSQDFLEMLSKWGIVFDAETIIGDGTLGARVSWPNERGGADEATYPLWLFAQQEALSREDITTGELRHMIFKTVGTVSLAQGSSLRLFPLVQTSRTVGYYDKESLKKSPFELSQDLVTIDTPLSIVARVSGLIPSAFKPLPASSSSPSEKGLQKTQPDPTQKTSHIVLVGDVNFLEDESWVVIQEVFGQKLVYPQAQNGQFILNVLDHLCGDDSMIALRSRKSSARPFTKVEKMLKAAQEQYMQEEQRLQEKLVEIRQKINALYQQTEDSIKAQNIDQITALQTERIALNRALRTVQLHFRKDIETLENRIKILNIALVPVGILLMGLLIVFIRWRKRKDVYTRL